MSFALIHRAYRESIATGTARLVLFILAEHADERGECFPSMARLAACARVGERQARRAVHTLVGLGELTVIPGGGRSRTNRFRVVLNGDGNPDTGDRVTGDTKPGLT